MYHTRKIPPSFRHHPKQPDPQIPPASAPLQKEKQRSSSPLVLFLLFCLFSKKER